MSITNEDGPSEADMLRRARVLYAAAPSHAPVGQKPEKGTHCPITALSSVRISPVDLISTMHRLITEIPDYDSVAEFNATHSTAEVLEVFDRAIEGCKESMES